MEIRHAIDNYLKHCSIEKNLSSKTLKAYETDLMQFCSFLKGFVNLQGIHEIDKTHIRAYLADMSLLKPKSIKRKVASLKALFTFLEFEDLIQPNPLRKMRIRIKEPKTLPTVMNIEEVSKIYSIVFDYKHRLDSSDSFAYFTALRNVVVIELLFTTGARVSEISNIKPCNINLETGNIKLLGKGSKERNIQICSSESLAILNEYYESFSSKIIACNYFLINRLGKKLSEQSIRTIVKNITNSADISKRITPHTFRHSFATLLLEQDVDIKYIQAMLGHTSILTTQLYTHVNSAKQYEILKTKHPRKSFIMT